MGRSTAALRMDEDQRRALQGLERSSDAPPPQVVRARALLLAASGRSNVEIAGRCHVAPGTVRTWRVRFEELGVASVLRTHPGRLPAVEPCFAPGGDRVLLGLYAGRDERAAVWSGEPTRVRAGLRCVHRDHRARSHQDFLLFLRTVEAFTPAGVDVHVLVDRCWSLTRHGVVVWLARSKRERFHVYRVADPSSWSGLVRRWRHEIGPGDPSGQWVFGEPSHEVARPGDLSTFLHV